MSEEVKSESEKKKEDWMNSKWRPMMGWMYMVVCFFDFVIAPILWSIIQALYKGGINVQWQPLTLQGAGLFHIAMGAVLGLAAYGRTQEKLGGANNGGLQSMGSGSPAAFGSATTAPSSFSAPASTGFGNPVATASVGGSGFGGVSMPASSFGATSKPMPTFGKPASTGPVDSDYMPPRD